MHYRLKQKTCAAIQYTGKNDENLISFGGGYVAFKEVFNAKLKDFEYKLMLIKGNGQDAAIPLGYYIIRFDDNNYEIYSKEKFKKTFVHIEQICDDDILDKEYCFCCGYYKNATCEFGNTLRDLKEKERVLLQRNKEYAAIKKAEQDMYKSKKIYEKYMKEYTDESLLEDLENTERKENLIKTCLKIIFIILIPLILVLPTK